MDCRGNRYIKESVGKVYVIPQILLDSHGTCLVEHFFSKLFKGSWIRKENTQNPCLVMEKEKDDSGDLLNQGHESILSGLNS